jgi:hypothetical protein
MESRRPSVECSTIVDGGVVAYPAKARHKGQDFSKKSNARLSRAKPISNRLLKIEPHPL